MEKIGLTEIYEQLENSSYGAENWTLWKVDQK
jgi:hypothetical protein